MSRTAGQSKQRSALESLTNIAVGFFLAIAVGQVVFPLFGAPITLDQNFVITTIFTVVSFARSYAVRRFFNWIETT